MKKILMTVGLALLSVSSFAALQYQMLTNSNGTQNWTPAYEIKLKVTEGGSLWFSSFVSNWYGGTLPDLGSIANMSAGNYGATVNGTNQVLGTGENKTVTFTNDQINKSITTQAYYVGDFKAGDEVTFWITNNTGVVGSSIGLVNQPDTLQSRQINTVDVAGNTRINFGFGNGSIEFIAMGGEAKGGPVGQPLPGVVIGLLVGGGLLSAAAIRRKKAEKAARQAA